MAKETNWPDPPAGHIAIVGWDSVNARWQAVHVDAAGLVQIDVAGNAVPQANAHGFDGSNWRKLQQLWGYTDRWVETVSELNAGAGANNIFTAAVPAGYVYVCNLCDCFNNTSASTRLLGATDGTNNVILTQEAGIAAGGITISGYCWVVLKEGDQMRARFTGCTAGDDLYLRVWGFKMKIDD